MLADLQTRLWALLDTDHDFGPVERARSRALQLTALGGLMGVAWGLAELAMGRWFIGVSILVSCTASFAVVRLARQGRLEAAAHLSVVMLMLSFTGALFHRGGLQGSHPAWLILVPLAAFSFLGRRWGLIYAVAMMSLAVAVWSLQALGVLQLEMVDPELRFRLALADYCGVFILALFYIWCFFEGHVGVMVALDERQQALETEVQERQQAEAVALEAVQVRGQFMATMSHEIRTPLNGVLGMADVLLDSDLDDEQRELMEMLQGSGHLLRRLLDDVLDFSKIDSGRMDLETLPVDLPALGRQLLDSIRPQAQDKDIQVRLEVAPNAPRWVVSDPVRLGQILGNLLSNALKFTSHGSITLRIQPVDAGVRLEVQDTGIGMSPVQLASVFRPFVQADSSTTRRFGGTGLGLSISRRLAELMGGELVASSEAGQGSTFRVTLPLSVCEAPSVTSEDTLGLSGLEGLRVLVAEDNPVNRVVISRILERLGVVVTLAEDGQQALEMWRGEDPDLVLMDCRMPVMDGYEATQQIRAEGGQLPIIALTANNMSGDRQRSLEAGMDDHLGKPIDPAALAAALERWISERAA